MKEIENYVFDLDDTWVGTRRYANQRIFTSGDLTAIRQIREANVTGMPTQILDSPAREAAWNFLKDGQFMLAAPPTASVERNLPALRQWLERKRKEGKRFHICTHRDWHHKGLLDSSLWLEKYDLRKYIDDIHCISTKEYPNKPDFLSAVYGNDWLLFDDNPVHQDSKTDLTLGLEKHLMVCRSEHSFPYAANLPGFKCISEVINTL